jgi:hypothetical protein
LPDRKDLLRNGFLAIRYSSYSMMFAALLISLGFGGQNLLGFVGPLLLIGAFAGSVSLHLAWANTFRFLYGLVTVMAALWAQLNVDTPFYVGWSVLLLGLAGLLLGGVSLETRYLSSSAKQPETGGIGRASLRKTVIRIGTYLFVLTVVSLLAVLSSFAFSFGTFPLWAVAVSTAGLVLMFAYLVSKSAEATDQNG